MTSTARLRNESGFSLIELMIVVAIIGILATIAVPNFTRFQAKAKQSEAKGYLSAIYTAEKSHLAEWDRYVGYVTSLGFQLEGNPRYIDVGFNTHTAYTTTPPGWTAGASPLAARGTPANLNAVCTNNAAGTTFLACAEGNIDTDATIDEWRINESRTMTNSTNDTSD